MIHEMPLVSLTDNAFEFPGMPESTYQEVVVEVAEVLLRHCASPP
jgi:hypothetical protein